MTTFTDKELIKEIKERIGSLDVRDNIERRAYEIALASLEAEPVVYMWDSERKDIDAPGYYRTEHLVFAESSVKQWGGRVVPLYTAQPVPVTPDGWISCSERMPDKLIPVMVMYEDGEMWSAMWNGNRWDDGTEYPDPHSVTHWREMPAAPKQEVNRG
ncbi:DUF551 domain-containing protein [Escherichia coli]|nr:DUF551 domain-containing protein [Escherichia coli]ELJ1033135.1 DUF551 domain-containing protein [Escherichia coli O2]ELB9165179.1 DUF551 domain-containing protein [Escherichia coli]ELB9715480.1 DUF551 domain-containing protein [Escherichia coli]ELW6898754.1 DUF551 domain-containing protein [Escherichia coli]